MKAEFKIKRQIIKEVKQVNSFDIENDFPEIGPLETEEDINKAWTELYADWLGDAKCEFRHSGEDTKIPARDWSRHYESKEVGVKLDDGSWVGWTYWSGGGKHGDPDGIDWIEDAYDLNVLEEEKLMIVRTFKIK